MTDKEQPIAKAAEILGKSQRTILRWIQSGKVPAQKIEGAMLSVIVRCLSLEERGECTNVPQVSSQNGHGLDGRPALARNQTIDATSSGGHRHTITLTSQDYQSIRDGNEVAVTSSSNSGHTHTFSIKK